MKNIELRLLKDLGVIIPDTYKKFLKEYGADLTDNPFDKKGWTPGLAGIDFVIGTTLAFRSRFSKFPHDHLIIGYVGIQKIPKTDEDQDLFLMMNVKTGEIFEVNSFDIVRKVADSFEEWMEASDSVK